MTVRSLSSFAEICIHSVLMHSTQHNVGHLFQVFFRYVAGIYKVLAFFPGIRRLSLPAKTQKNARYGSWYWLFFSRYFFFEIYCHYLQKLKITQVWLQVLAFFPGIFFFKFIVITCNTCKTWSSVVNTCNVPENTWKRCPTLTQQST